MPRKKGSTTGYIVKSQNDHPAILAERLGEMDRFEIEVFGITPKVGLELSYKFADKCWSGIHDEELILMFGVSSLAKIFPDLPDVDGVGVPWLLGTGDYTKCWKKFLKLSKVIKEEMYEMYPVLRNFVSADNKVSVNWLDHIGFEMVELRENFRNSGKDFYLFESIRR